MQLEVEGDGEQQIKLESWAEPEQEAVVPC